MISIFFSFLAVCALKYLNSTFSSLILSPGPILSSNSYVSPEFSSSSLLYEYLQNIDAYFKDDYYVLW